MSFLNGRITSVWYRALEPFDLNKVKAALSENFQKLTAVEREIYGFVSSINLNETPATDQLSITSDNYVYFDLRRDFKPINNRLVKAELARIVKEERNGKRFSKAEKKEQLEKITEKMIAQATPQTGVWSCFISLDGKLVGFGSGSKKLNEVFVDLIRIKFDVTLERVNAFTAARDWSKSANMATETAQSLQGGFLQKTIDQDAVAEDLLNASPVEGLERYGFLGSEFLTWLINRADREAGFIANDGEEWKTLGYDRVEMISRNGYKLRLSGTGTQESPVPSRITNEEGGLTSRCTLVLQDPNEVVWAFNFDPLNWVISGLKLPVEKGNGDEAATRFLRGEMLEHFINNVMFQAYGNFLTVRVVYDNWKKEAKKLREWGTTEAAV